MKALLGKLWRTGLMSIVEGLLFFPILAILHVYVMNVPEFWLWLLSIPILYLIGSTVRILWPSPKTFLYHLFIVTISFVYAWLLFGVSFEAAVSILVIWLALYRGGKYARSAPQDMLTTTHYIIGILLYFIVSIYARYAEGFQTVSAILTWCGLFALVVSLFMINRNVLEQESLQGEKKRSVVKSVLWKNRILLLMFAGVIAVITAFGWIREAVVYVLRKIGELIAWLLSLGGGEEEVRQQPPEQQSPMLPPMEEPSEPALFWVILEMIVKWAAIIIGALLVLYLLYKLIKLIVRGVKALYAWLMERLQLGDLAHDDHGYEDEVEQLADWKDLRKQWTDRLKGLFTLEEREKWHKLTSNSQRIRFLYRTALTRYMQEGYSFRAALTPRETKQDVDRWGGKDKMQQQLVELYENARYGGKEPSDEELAAVKRSLEDRTGRTV